MRPFGAQEGGAVVFDEDGFGGEAEVADQAGNSLRPHFLFLPVQKKIHDFFRRR